MCGRAWVSACPRVSAGTDAVLRGPRCATSWRSVAVRGESTGINSFKHLVSGFLSGLSQNAGGRGGGGERVREGVVGGSGFLLRFQAKVGPVQVRCHRP